jgi:hypothetical protein
MDDLRASLEPVAKGDRWKEAGGSVIFDARTGAFTVTLQGMPEAGYGRAYVGWVGGVSTLSGDPVSTGNLTLSGGSLEARFEATWVQGPRIDYFYTLGLAYFYMAECDKAYPLFNAALQIDPEDQNALKGIQLCKAAESEG